MKRNMLLGGLVLVAGLGVAAIAAAQPRDAGPAPRGGKGAWRDDRPQLTRDQQRKLADLRAALIRRTAVLRAELEVKHTELGQLWRADQPSRQAILAKHVEIDGVQRQLREARVDFRLQALRVLTPEQRAAMGPGAFGHGPGFGRGMGPGRGPCGGFGPGRGMGGRMGRGRGFGPWAGPAGPGGPEGPRGPEALEPGPGPGGPDPAAMWFGPEGEIEEDEGV